MTQTTLSVDDTQGIIAALQRKFSNIVGPETRDICYATQNRQSAVRELSKLVDVILVVGATNSSNSNRLREIGSEEGMPSYLIADGSELDPKWLEGVKTVGITAGASAPEVLVDDVIEALRRLGPVDVSILPGRQEKIEFRLPAGTRQGILTICPVLGRRTTAREWKLMGDSVPQGDAHRRLSAQAEAAWAASAIRWC